jgi:hypothetical protein
LVQRKNVFPNPLFAFGKTKMKRITRMLALPVLALALLLVGDASKADAQGFGISIGTGGHYGHHGSHFGSHHHHGYGSHFGSSGLYSSGYGGYHGGGHLHSGHGGYYQSYRPAIVVPVAPVYRSHYGSGFGYGSGCGY